MKVRPFLSALDSLQQAFFACYSGQGGNDAVIARARQRLYHAVHKLRRMAGAENMERPERLYETIFLFGQLRFRVRDKALFEVCRQELSAISECISAVLRAGDARSLQNAQTAFDGVTGSLEELYDSVLCITAREPEVFQFLFAHLRMFRTEIDALMKETLFAVDA